MTSATKTPIDPTTRAGTPKVSASPLLKRLRAERKERLKDDERRRELGLRYVGIEYGPFGREPRQLFRDDMNRYFVKLGNSNYREIPK